ncbi:conserved hypothetical protein [Segniliparus rotundus DSM 44985]|uniref:Uncharacterized protein n=1 Tax=Segniliparus rotundus (strain ATCC BAA-972 / CDC 1076 / CIP 108378 / DSM 44985 / JCM 13578) TaxID=640132 RepID=D6ZAW0_SEGRD|nr:hypothetical protein [Segniliparus rotundus]ADG98846.1 conserved hypothetical protein [Segniliparus rotundus DSM 44985]
MSEAKGRSGGRSVWDSPWVPIVVAVMQVFILAFDFWRLDRGVGSPGEEVAQCVLAFFAVVWAVWLLVKHRAQWQLGGVERLPEFFLGRPLSTGFAAGGFALVVAAGLAWALR